MDNDIFSQLELQAWTSKQKVFKTNGKGGKNVTFSCGAKELCVSASGRDVWDGVTISN
mgnify:FL=1